MCDQRGPDELCVVPVPYASLYFCAKSATEEKKTEYRRKGGIDCQKKVEEFFFPAAEPAFVLLSDYRKATS